MDRSPAKPLFRLGPVVQAVLLARAVTERRQRESHGVLWAAGGMTWSVNGRVRYLPPEQVPGEDGR